MIEVSVPCLGYELRARVHFAGPDLWVLVTGGSEPHIGSVSVGVPRPSLQEGGPPSATVSTINHTAHKDDIVGNCFAATLSARFSCLVTVGCGIHFHKPKAEDLHRVLVDAGELLDKLVAILDEHDAPGITPETFREAVT